METAYSSEISESARKTTKCMMQLKGHNLNNCCHENRKTYNYISYLLWPSLGSQIIMSMYIIKCYYCLNVEH
jgi:hypothetical protein